MSRRPTRASVTTAPVLAPAELGSPLAGEVRKMILQAKDEAARTIDATLVALHWHVGRRIREDVLHGARATYADEIVSTLSRHLEPEFGRGFSEKSLRHMLRFAEAFPDLEIVSTLWRQLSWSHFKTLAYLKEPLKRDFYAEMCRVERWSVRVLAQKIGGMLFERTALAKQPEAVIQAEIDTLRAEDRFTPALVFQDPYVLDFLDLGDRYSERDLESAILRELERFLLELGAGFAFVARQKRITLDGDDYYIDLLFYHRRLRRLVVVELKLGDFKPADAGQVELYLRWLDRHERQPGEESPLGIILCAGKKAETVEYLDLDRSGIHVAEYLTALPSREVLQKKLHDALALARLKNEAIAARRED